MGSSNLSDSIYIPKQWSDAVEFIAYDSITSPPPIVLVCGAKNCGKTTFSRHLLNVFLLRYKKVAYLDTDVGQSEFTPPGFVSLTVVDTVTPDLAVPCLKTPERCFFFGDVSSKRDPVAYLSYVFALFDHYQKEFYVIDKVQNSARTEVPLVINTPGWVKGVGYDTLVDMLRYIRPTHVIKINISSEIKNLPAGAFWLDEECNGKFDLIEICSARQDSFNRSGDFVTIGENTRVIANAIIIHKEKHGTQSNNASSTLKTPYARILVQKDSRLLRDLRIMAYFRQCFPREQNITTIKELARALASHQPFEVSISCIKIKHLYCQVPSTELFFSLNACIAGLAIDSEGSKALPASVGLGIVRGIDTFKGVLYVLTPVPQATLEKVDLLLMGFIQIPTCLLQVKGCMSPYMSANTLPTSS